MYPNLFRPMTIGTMQLKNRIVMLPMGSNMGGAYGELSEEHILYYEQRARGGTGLIIVENACVDAPLGLNGATQIRMDHDRYIPKMYQLTETLHRYGACAALQLNHAGSSAVPERIGGQCVSSWEQPSKEGGAIPRMLETEEIREIAEKYGEAAKRAVMAGFDCVEIHCGHSYLISQFISPVFNQRTDEFGGSPERRAEFPWLVLKKVREAVGSGFPIDIRISAEDLVDGGNTIEDMIRILACIDEYADLYNVSVGLPDSMQYQLDTMQLPEGWKADLSKTIKDKFGKPTIAVGNIRTPRIAEQILEEEKADLIGIGRGLIADPQWANKAEAGQEDQIRPCISCNIGCAGNRLGCSRPIRCTVNPDIVHGEEYKNSPVKKQTNVVVIGAGTAGMEAACTAAEVGCSVFLIEQTAHVGGLSSEISKFPNKARIAAFSKYLENRMERLDNLYLLTETTADWETIEKYKPHLVICATGSQPLLPPIPGLRERVDQPGSRVKSVLGLLSQMDEVTGAQGQKAVVAGGGAVGLDTAEYLAERGMEVTLIEWMDCVGKDLDPVTALSVKESVKKHGIKILTKTKLLEVTDNVFAAEGEQGMLELAYDLGMICMGMKPVGEAAHLLERCCAQQGIAYQNIGDSYRARKILNGVFEGRNILTRLKRMGRM